MESQLDTKKTIIQINSLAISNSVYLLLIFLDVYQKDMKI
jgi:hypothetical protein